MQLSNSRVIGEFKGFELSLKNGFFNSDEEIIIKGNKSYSIKISESSHGNIIKLENVFKGFEKQIENGEIKIDEINRNLNQAKEEFKKSFVHKNKLNVLSRRQSELNSELDMDKDVIIAEEIEIKVDEKNKIDETDECL